MGRCLGQVGEGREVAIAVHIVPRWELMHILGELDDGLELRGKVQGLVFLAVVQGLNAEKVPGGEKISTIGNNKCKDSVG